MVKSIRKMGHEVERLAEDDDDVQYDLTDYSSNESSNDAVYKYEYRDDLVEN
jgi:predicted DNA binding CopG/RHH family protein